MSTMHEETLRRHEEQVLKLSGIGTQRLEASKAEVAAGLAKYGSSANWPTLLLLPEQFPMCVCGHARKDHRPIGEECLATECVDNPDGCGWFVAKVEK